MWFKDGQPLDVEESPKYRPSMLERGLAMLSIVTVNYADMGVYSCQAEDDNGRLVQGFINLTLIPGIRVC